ncbi:MAG: electron transfer flavoprotein subunit alpha/FixB family protein [Eubacteriales bacterium]
MGQLVIHHDQVTDPAALVATCPFGALEVQDGRVTVNAACKLCRVCVKRAKNGEITYIEEQTPAIDLTEWQGIAVCAEQNGGQLHPVTFELIGRGRQLADKAGQSLSCVLMGQGLDAAVAELRHYPIDSLFVYDHPALRDFRMEPYTATLADFVTARRPAVLLAGGTPLGRQLAPRVAARFRTGLTADCTVLDIGPDGELVQIRPAFGGNIMAQIATTRHRPQMATVRYKVMQACPRAATPLGGQVIPCALPKEGLLSGVTVLASEPKPPVRYLEEADIIVAAGQGVKTKEDLALVRALADALGGELAASRPLIEAGWVSPRRQIGLSGRTVRPRLIITCGISGAVQFTAGMDSADHIIAINADKRAPIFRVAHEGIVGDLYEIIPALLAGLKDKRRNA